MSNIDKQALREAAEKAGSDEWCAFIDTKSKTYAVHTPADNRCGDVVKWAGFDGQQRAAAKAKFIAAANPAIVLNLLDELEAKDQRIAELEAREVVLPQRYSMLHRVDFDEAYHTEMVYKQHQVLEALHDAGVNVAAAGKGEVS